MQNQSQKGKGSYSKTMYVVCYLKSHFIYNTIIIFSYFNGYMHRPFIIAVLLCLVLAQELGKTGPLPMCDIFVKNVARNPNGSNDFWKVDVVEWSHLSSALPIRSTAITTVDFFLVYGNDFSLGVATVDPLTGQVATALAFHTKSGKKVVYGDHVDYSTPCITGDSIKMTINMLPNVWTLSFARNGLDLGVAFSGLNRLGQVFILLGLAVPGERIKITDYQVPA